MSTYKLTTTVLTAFVVSALLIYSPMLVDWANRNQKEQLATAHLSALRSELYVPQGVTVLREIGSIRPLNYFNDCFGASVRIIYGSNRPRSEIRALYAQALADAGWELDPGYKRVEDYQVYQKGDENNLALDTTEAQNPAEQSFQVVYSVWLTYLTPSHNQCTG